MIFLLFIVTTLPSLVVLQDDSIKANNIYFTPEKIIAEGYKAERHHVETSDGYILEMHRIPFARYQNGSDLPRPPVLVMHGLLAASNSYVALGPEHSIVYNLADAGFDVWMGNARGTKNSRRHKNLNPDDPSDKFKFFDFTWQQIGMYDIAAMVDYILEMTKRMKLHYIGHSQGGTVFLILNSMRPEYNDRFLSAHLLAGVGYKEHFPLQLLKNVASMTDTIYALALKLGIVELFPLKPIKNNRISDYCAGDVTLKYFCDLIQIDILFDSQNPSEEYKATEVGGAALKQIAHYGQNIRDKTFRRWDYGDSIQNIAAYGSVTPPKYDISLITVNVTMHYTLGDILLGEGDVLAMVKEMPNTIARKVERDTFTHTDFVYSKDLKELVTNHIIDVMKSREEQYIPDEGSTGAGLSIHFNMCFIILTIYLIRFYNIL